MFDYMYVFIVLLTVMCGITVYFYMSRKTADDNETEIMVCEITVDGMTVYEPELELAWHQLINGDWGDSVQVQCIPMKKKYFEGKNV